MRYVVLGAGAIGGVAGGRLFAAGHEVTLVARGAHLDAIQRGGLRIESPEGAEVLQVAAVGHPGEIDWGPGTVVLMAVKSHQTDVALSALAEAAPEGTPIVCLQNGVVNEPAALRRFPNVYGVWVAFPASHLEPGVVQSWSSPVVGLLDIGRYPDGIDEVCGAVAADLRGASFGSEAIADVRRWKYRKLLGNLGNAVEAVCSPEEGRRERRDLLHLVVSEGEAVLAAAGCEAATEEEDRARRGNRLQIGDIAGQTRMGGSSWQSLQRGTGDIETDYLNGEIVLLGRLHGVPTPANALLQRLARNLAAGRLAPGSMPAGAALAQLAPA